MIALFINLAISHAFVFIIQKHRHDSKDMFSYVDIMFFILLRYESSTPILYKELSSTIFQSLSVSQSGIGNTCPDLHFVQYIKA